MVYKFIINLLTSVHTKIVYVYIHLIYSNISKTSELSEAKRSYMVKNTLKTNKSLCYRLYRSLLTLYIFIKQNNYVFK